MSGQEQRSPADGCSAAERLACVQVHLQTYYRQFSAEFDPTFDVEAVAVRHDLGALERMLQILVSAAFHCEEGKSAAVGAVQLLSQDEQMQLLTTIKPILDALEENSGTESEGGSLPSSPTAPVDAVSPASAGSTRSSRSISSSNDRELTDTRARHQPLETQSSFDRKRGPE